MKVLYSGSFNPFHNGHQYVYDTACEMFGKENVWLGVGKNREKSTDVDRIAWSLVPITNNIITYDTLTANLVKEQGFDFLVRGVRTGQSIEQEEKLAYWNQRIGNAKTVLVPTTGELNQISSSILRELHSYNEPITPFMNHEVFARWVNFHRISVFYGKSCMGKSTYLTNYDYIFNADTQIWDYYKGTFPVDRLKRDLKSTFLIKDERFNSLVQYLAQEIDWYALFVGYHQHSIFDFPAIGHYWNSIPDDIKGLIKLYRIETSDENRTRNIAARGLDAHFIECSDHFYIEPPFCDEVIKIN